MNIEQIPFNNDPEINKAEASVEVLPEHQVVPKKIHARKAIDTIEKTRSPHVEQGYIKYPGDKIKEAKSSSLSPTHYTPDFSRIEPEEKKGQKYNFIHTHPSNTSKLLLTPEHKAVLRSRGFREDGDYKKVDAGFGLHSGGDFNLFLRHDAMRTATIAVRDPDTGTVLGYNVLRKTKLTPKSYDQSVFKNFFKRIKFNIWDEVDISGDVGRYDSLITRAALKGNMGLVREFYDEFLKKYHLKSRLVPAKGYKVNASNTSFEIDNIGSV
jgi:hypothetical protein